MHGVGSSERRSTDKCDPNVYAGLQLNFHFDNCFDLERFTIATGRHFRCRSVRHPLQWCSYGMNLVCI